MPRATWTAAGLQTVTEILIFCLLYTSQQFGAKVVAMSDSNGYVYDPEGIKLDVVKEIKDCLLYTSRCV